MNRQFPALRGTAILIVVLYHSIEWATLGPQSLGYPPANQWERYVLSALLQLGVFAVPTFLFISGSFMAYAARGNPPTVSWKTIRAGLARIIGPYVIWSIAFYLTVYVRWDEAYTVTEYLKNLVVGYPYHFVPLLLLFYVLSPPIVRLAEQWAWLIVAGIGIYQIVLMKVQFQGIFGLGNPTWMQYLVPPVFAQTFADWGIYFPLGLVYGLKMKSLLPWLKRIKWVSLGATCTLLVVSILNAVSILHVPLAGRLCSLTAMFVLPTIGRNHVPNVRQFEGVGKKSYGLYLMHLVVLSFGFLALQLLTPRLLNHPMLVTLVLFTVGVILPIWIMNITARLLSRPVYRYVFG